MMYTCGDCKYFERMKGKDYKYGKCPFKKYNQRGRFEGWLPCSEFQTRNGEYINRQDVLNILISNWQDRDGDDAMQTSIDAIRIMPALKQIGSRTGHWIDTHGDSWICSECGVEAYIDEDWHKSDDRAYKQYFCHYCGADMRGKSDEST